MAKSVTAGEMRTRITVATLTAGEDAEGFPTETWVNVLASAAYATMPAASLALLGHIVQYTGTTTTTPPIYTQNALYLCVSNGATVPTYSWQAFTEMLRCKWVGAFGSDVLENKRVELGQTATITMRYTSLIDQRCRVFHENDAQTDVNAWEIISVNDPEDKHAFLEITLRRKVVA